ncbi:MAG TPA: hypothetical protein VF759_16010 [Allosphingosinicella sp.]|jgi:hypothetical protein
MLGPIAAAMLLGVSSGPVQVDVGRADWNGMPRLKRAARQLPTPAMVARVEQMLATRACTFPRQNARKFDITVPYAVLVEPEGRARRVVVADSGCPALETYVGQLILGMARDGDFKATGEAKARWYSSALNFNLK